MCHVSYHVLCASGSQPWGDTRLLSFVHAFCSVLRNEVVVFSDKVILIRTSSDFIVLRVCTMCIYRTMFPVGPILVDRGGGTCFLRRVPVRPPPRCSVIFAAAGFFFRFFFFALPVHDKGWWCKCHLAKIITSPRQLCHLTYLESQPSLKGRDLWDIGILASPGYLIIGVQSM